MSFEHAMDRIYTLINAFSFNSRRDVTIFSAIQKIFLPSSRIEKLHHTYTLILFSYVLLFLPIEHTKILAIQYVNTTVCVCYYIIVIKGL